MALLAGGGVALLAGLDGGLLLLGLPAPVTTARLLQVHGPLLVLGFVGTLVALERAVALRRRRAVVAPALLGTGGLVLLAGAVPLSVGQAVLAAGCAAALVVEVRLWQRRPCAAMAVEVLGATVGLGAAVLWWAGVPVPALVPWLAVFLVLVIAAEREELGRIGGRLGGGADGSAAVLLAVAVLAGLGAATLWPGAGHALLGLALLALVARLLAVDVARRTVRSTGLPRYVAVCLLCGYGWLAVAGAAWLVGGAATEGPAYDAVVHAVFVGFVITMIMAHAPVILPAVLRRPVPYHRALYAPVALLQASLVLRLVGGDAHGQFWALRTGGALGVAAVLLLPVVLVVATRVRRRTPRAGAGRDPDSTSGPSTPAPPDVPTSAPPAPDAPSGATTSLEVSR